MDKTTERAVELPASGLRRMDLNLLVAFDAVLRARRVTEAARAVGMSQPALSYALGRLREITGDPLFVRTRDGMVPTPRAEALRGPVQQALALVAGAFGETAGFDPARSDRLFTLCLTDIGEVVALPPLLRHIESRGLGVRIRTLPLESGRVAGELASGGADLAVSTLPGLVSGFYQQRIFVESYACVLRAAHPLLDARGRLSREGFLSARHALVTAPGTGHDVIERTLAALGVAERIALRLPHFLTVPHVVADTDLVAVVPRLLARAFAGAARVRVVPPPVAVPRYEVKQVWHERMHHDPGHRWLRALVARLLQRHGKGGDPA